MDQNMTDTPIQENLENEMPKTSESEDTIVTEENVTPDMETPVIPTPSTQQVPPVQPEKEDKLGYGITSLVLGIISLCCFACCTNFLTAIIAIIFGILQMVKYKRKGFAVTGIILSIASILLSVLLLIATLFAYENGAFNGMENPEYMDELMNEVYGEEFMNELEGF